MRVTLRSVAMNDSTLGVGATISNYSVLSGVDEQPHSSAVRRRGGEAMDRRRESGTHALQGWVIHMMF